MYTASTVGTLIGYTYCLSALSAFVALAIAFALVNTVKTQPGAEGAKNSVHTRRLFFWIIAIFPPIINLVLDFVVFRGNVKASAVDKYFAASIGSVLASFAFYVIVAVILSKTILKHNRFSTVF